MRKHKLLSLSRPPSQHNAIGLFLSLFLLSTSYNLIFLFPFPSPSLYSPLFLSFPLPFPSSPFLSPSSQPHPPAMKALESSGSVRRPHLLWDLRQIPRAPILQCLACKTGGGTLLRAFPARPVACPGSFQVAYFFDTSFPIVQGFND